jgi:phosphoribosylanthranilate isomerase
MVSAVHAARTSEHQLTISPSHYSTTLALLTSVLVRGINNLSDARYCAGMGADSLTFRLDPELPGAVTPELVQELSSWVAGVQLVGEFGALPVGQINELVQRCGLQQVLLHSLRRPEEMAELLVPALVLVEWIPDMLPEDVDRRFQLMAPHVGGFVFAELPAEPFTEAQLTRLTEQARSYQLWLAPGFAPGTVRELIEAVQPQGLVLEGGDEIRPGVRDFSEMEAVFEALEID